MITEAVEIKLQRFRFHEPAARHVIDDERGEVRLAGNGANRRKFRKGEARDIIAVRMRIGHPVEHRIAWRGGDRDRAAELRRLWHCELCWLLGVRPLLYRPRREWNTRIQRSWLASVNRRLRLFQA